MLKMSLRPPYKRRVSRSWKARKSKHNGSTWMKWGGSSYRLYFILFSLSSVCFRTACFIVTSDKARYFYFYVKKTVFVFDLISHVSLLNFVSLLLRSYFLFFLENLYMFTTRNRYKFRFREIPFVILFFFGRHVFMFVLFYWFSLFYFT